jgi:hypothetical protein
MEFWNHSHFAKLRRTKGILLLTTTLHMQKGFSKKKNQISATLVYKKALSLCKLLKHKLVASPHLPQHVSGTGTNVQLSEEKERERERDANLC